MEKYKSFLDMLKVTTKSENLFLNNGQVKSEHRE